MRDESPLVTKLHAPPVRAKRVLRPRLTARLNEGLTRKLTLISATAGAGKTTLLTEWHLTHAANQLRLAWVSLDEHDDDLVRFWTYVITALQTIRPRIGASARLSLDAMALPNLSAPRDEPAWIESALTSLINDFALTPNDVAVVLDDYHSIESPIIHNSVAFLLDHLPPNLHLIIASREDPPLPVARLRARDQMIELRSADLRFTPDEVSAFFDKVMGLPLARQDASAIEARTEGWIAGLQMAALALREQHNPSQFIASFTGSHHFVMDYMLGEVLQRQPQDIQAFLLQTSVLERLNGALCDAVTRRTDSQTILEKLDTSNLFLVPLDSERRWYRYHHLFAELLQHRLNLSHAEKLSALHQRASDWYEQADNLFDAINHAVAARDWEHAAQLLEQVVQKNRIPWMFGEVARISRWLDALPQDLVRARLRLSIACAWTHLLMNQFERVESSLDDAIKTQATLDDANDQRAWQGAIATARTFLANMRGDMELVIQFAPHALETLSEEEVFLKSLVALSLADAYYFVRYDARAAQQAYSQALSWGQSIGNHAVVIMSLSGLASLSHMRGRLRETEHMLRQTIALSDEWNVPDFFSMSNIYWLLAWVEYWWNHTETAIAHLQTSLQIARQWKFPLLSVYAYGALAVMKQAHGDMVGASEMLRQAELIAQESSAPFAVTMLAYYRLWVWTSQGNLPTAMRLIEEHATEWGDKNTRTYALLMRAVARTYIAQGQAESNPTLIQRALESLEETLPPSEAMGLDGDVIVNLSLQALAHQALGQVRQATRILTRALTLAEPEGNIRLFVDFGKPMAQLLVRVAESEPGLRSYASKLLAHFGATPSAEKLVEPLTDRELDVLRRVTSGATDQEIAEQLIVSKATVKTHLRNIYGKLQVKNRTQAILRARVLGLLQ